MKYPTIKEVEATDDIIQLMTWYRKLPAAGDGHYGKPDFKEVCEHQSDVLRRINQRMHEVEPATTEQILQFERSMR